MHNDSQYTMYQIDAFTNVLFRGNPAAVFVLDEFLPDAVMQALAMENNLAETAFVVPRGAHYDLRWFTPAKEAAFCGHATLAAAHALIAEYGVEGPLTFHTSAVGPLHVTYEDSGRYDLSLPRLEPEPLDDDLGETLGLTPKCVFRNFENLFAVLDSERSVRTFVPNLARISRVDAGGLVITAAGATGGDVDFVSRYFAPQAGIPEDPVTGSIHSTLVPYWSQVLNKPDLTAEQCSARGGRLRCRLSEDRVRLGGQAITYMEATVRLTRASLSAST